MTWQRPQILSLQEFRRTDGRNNQELIPIKKFRRNLFKHTKFFKLFTEEGTFFGKKVLVQRRADNERTLLQEVQHERIVPFLGEDEEYGFIFPFIDGTNLEKVKWKTIKNREEVLEQLQDFYGFLETCETSLGLLIELVDTHKNNFIMEVQDCVVQNWWFIDLEKVNKNCMGRNLKYLESYKGYFGL